MPKRPAAPPPVPPERRAHPAGYAHRLRWQCSSCQLASVARAGTAMDALASAVLRHRSVSPGCASGGNLTVTDTEVTIG